jgi:hypothetical protein
VQIEILHPDLVYRDCDHCQRFFYEEDGPDKGKVRLDRNGEPLDRPPGTSPPCRRSQGCPKGTPENQRVLTDYNRKAWDFHKRCKLTGRWPDDELVIQRGVLLEDVLSHIREVQETERMATLMMGAMV